MLFETVLLRFEFPLHYCNTIFFLCFVVIQVQTVLLLLGGRDIPTAVPTLELPFENSRVI